MAHFPACKALYKLQQNTGRKGSDMDDVERVEVTEVVIPFRDIDMNGRMRTSASIEHAEIAIGYFWRYRPPLEDEPVFAPLKIECRFYEPIRLDDKLRLTVRVDKIGGKSVGFNVVFERGNRTVAEIDFIWGATDRETGEPVPLPEDIRDWLYQYLP